MRSRVRLAVAGAMFVGAIAAVIAWQSGAAASHPVGALALTTGQGVPTTGAGATATRSATSMPTSPPIPGPSPTSAPQPHPTPTQPAVGVQMTLRGQIPTNPSASSFLLDIGGSTVVTVVVNASTTYSGQATGLSSLQSGWQAHVTGAYQTDGTFLAVSVDAFHDD